MAGEIHGKNGRVYANPLLIQDCSSAWNEQAVTGVTTSAVPGPAAGMSAARATTAGVGAGTLLMSKALASLNLSAYAAIIYWFRSGVALTAGQLQLELSAASLGANPLEALSVPALAPNSWQACLNRLAAPSGDGAIIDVALKQAAAISNSSFDVSNVYAMREVVGMKTWTLKQSQSASEVTNFNDGGLKRFVAGEAGWSGTITGFKTGAPLSIGRTVYLALGEALNDGQSWIGEAVITGVTPKLDVKSVVAYTYSFTGSGILQVSVA